MKKTTKIIAAVAVTFVIIASIVTVSLIKDDEPAVALTTAAPYPVATAPFIPYESTTFDLGAYLSGALDLSTEPESSTLNPSDPNLSTTFTDIPTSIVYVTIPPIGDTGSQTVPPTQTPSESTTNTNNLEMYDYDWVPSGGNIIITNYFGSDMSPVIPDKINGLPVVSIGDNCFKNKKITSVYIPSTVNNIGVAAFSGCAELKNVYFLSNTSTVHIGASAFQNCKKLAVINLPTQTQTIGNNAFSNCSSLEKLTIPPAVTNIGASAFTGTSENFTIYCKQDTEALAAAVRDGIKYVVS